MKGSPSICPNSASARELKYFRRFKADKRKKKSKEPRVRLITAKGYANKSWGLMKRKQSRRFSKANQNWN